MEEEKISAFGQGTRNVLLFMVHYRKAEGNFNGWFLVKFGKHAE